MDDVSRKRPRTLESHSQSEPTLPQPPQPPQPPIAAGAETSISSMIDVEAIHVDTGQQQAPAISASMPTIGSAMVDVEQVAMEIAPPEYRQEPDQFLLIHQNRALVRRLQDQRQEIVNRDARIRTLESKIETNSDSISAIRRYWDLLDNDLRSIAAQSLPGFNAEKIKEDVPVSSHMSLLERLLGVVPPVAQSVLDEALQRRLAFTKDLLCKLCSSSGAIPGLKSKSINIAEIDADSRAQVRELSLKLSHSADEVQALRDKISELGLQIDDFEAINARSRRRAEAALAETEQARQSEKKMAEMVEELRQEVEQLKAGRTEAGDVVITGTAAEEIDKVKRELKETTLIAELREKEITKNRKQLEAYLQEIGKLRAAVSIPPSRDVVESSPFTKHLVDQISTLKQQQTADSARINVLQESLTAEQVARADEKKRFEEMITEWQTEYEKRLAKNTTTMSQLNAQRDDARRKEAEMKTLNESLNGRIEQLNTLLEAAKRVKKAEGEGEKATIESKVAEKDKEITTLKSEIERLESIVKDLTEEGVCNVDQKLASEIDRQEDRIKQLNEERDMSKAETKVLIDEMEGVCVGFEQLQKQNMQLLSQINEKDVAAAKLASDKVRLYQQVAALGQLVEDLKQKAITEQNRVNTGRDVWKKSEDRLKQLEEAYAKSKAEVRVLNANQDRLMRLSQEARDAAQTARNEAEQVFSEASSAAAVAADWSSRVMNQEEVVASLTEKLTIAESRIELSKGGAAHAAQVTALQVMVQKYRSYVKCTLCSNDREVSLRCGHMFCRPCIDKRVSARSRKCPMCNIKFSVDDIKSQMQSTSAEAQVEIEIKGKEIEMDRETPEEEARFQIELEFVNSLANPDYLLYLAQSKILNDGKMVNYLKYWKKPEYSRYIIFPRCLAILDLLQNPKFRAQCVYPQFCQWVAEQQFHVWKSGGIGVAEEEKET